jgi:hypothetical protein
MTPAQAIKTECRSCKGRLIDGDICNLHEFRLGTNPFAKKRTLSPERREIAIASLAKYRRESCSSGTSKPPGSTIALSEVQEGADHVSRFPGTHQ